MLAVYAVSLRNVFMCFSITFRDLVLLCGNGSVDY